MDSPLNALIQTAPERMDSCDEPSDARLQYSMAWGPMLQHPSYTEAFGVLAPGFLDPPACGVPCDRYDLSAV